MEHSIKYSKSLTLFLACRPKFLVASAAPVLVGTALAFAVSGSFNPYLFILALLAILALHAGANGTNDYFDHISRNDWLNQNPTPFSGGSRYIQQGLLSPQSMLFTGLLLLAIGSAIGVLIVISTQSVFVLALGLAGLLGGYFYTAAPVRLGYRCTGEIAIALLFGLLPVYGSYYLQVKTIDFVPLLPACIVGILIFLVILVNEFPDAPADAVVNKKTLIVCFGLPAGAWIYRIALVSSYVIAAAMLIYRLTFFAGLFYLFTLPVAVFVVKLVNKEDLAKPGQWRANQITILLHSIGCLYITIGFIVAALCRATA